MATKKSRRQPKKPPPQVGRRRGDRSRSASIQTAPVQKAHTESQSTRIRQSQDGRLQSWADLKAPGLCHIILDYGPGDLAGAEVLASVLGHMPADEWRIKEINVGSFDTVETGFCVAQLALQLPPFRPEKTMIYANCAPRKDRSQKRHDNEGEGLVLAFLSSGVLVVAVNSGYTLSFLKDEIEELWSTKISKKGSQFRSRDNFPAAIGMAANGEFSFIERRLNPMRDIPDAPLSVVAYVDSFGNVKTSIRSSADLVKHLKPGTEVELCVNGCYRKAFVGTGSFNVAEGEFAFSPGSSGHTDRYWEIFKRGGNAASEFGYPKKGAVVSIRLPNTQPLPPHRNTKSTKKSAR